MNINLYQFFNNNKIISIQRNEESNLIAFVYQTTSSTIFILLKIKLLMYLVIKNGEQYLVMVVISKYCVGFVYFEL